MGEVGGAVIAISLVLVAVFVPVAFFPGTTGRIYHQFALTIAVSVAHLGVQRADAHAGAVARCCCSRTGGQGGSSAASTRVIDAFAMLRRGRCGARAAARRRVASSSSRWSRPRRCSSERADRLHPRRGPGLLHRLDPGARRARRSSDERRRQAVETDARGAARGPACSRSGGFLRGNGPNHRAGLRAAEALGRAQRQGARRAGRDRAAARPALGIGGARASAVRRRRSTASARSAASSSRCSTSRAVPLDDLAGATRGLVGARQRDARARAASSRRSPPTPQLDVEVDRQKAKALGVPLEQVFGTLSSTWAASTSTTSTTRAARTASTCRPTRSSAPSPANIWRFYVRTDPGEMIPLDARRHASRPPARRPSATTTCFAPPRSTASRRPGVARARRSRRWRRSPGRRCPTAWPPSGTGRPRAEGAGPADPIIFALGLLFVFLVLAAQYESFALPFVVMLSVPLAILGACSASSCAGSPNDVFCQIGLVMLGRPREQERHPHRRVRRAAARARAVDPRGRGQGRRDRLRPILMTSIAFLLGVVPLMLATGAGGRPNSLGTAVFGGMLVSTLLNLYFIPVLYVGFETLREHVRSNRTARIRDNRSMQNDVQRVTRRPVTTLGVAARRLAASCDEPPPSDVGSGRAGDEEKCRRRRVLSVGMGGGGRVRAHRARCRCLETSRLPQGVQR